MRDLFHCHLPGRHGGGDGATSTGHAGMEGDPQHCLSFISPCLPAETAGKPHRSIHLAG